MSKRVRIFTNEKNDPTITEFQKYLSENGIEVKCVSYKSTPMDKEVVIAHRPHTTIEEKIYRGEIMRLIEYGANVFCLNGMNVPRGAVGLIRKSGRGFSMYRSLAQRVAGTNPFLAPHEVLKEYLEKGR